MHVFGKKQTRPVVKDRPAIESPVMDRDVALALFAAALAAVVLIVMQLGSGFDRDTSVASLDAASQPKSANVADAFERRAR